MQVTETLSEGLKRAYTVVVPAADVEGRRTARLSELGRTLRLPGFRPGKVPLPVVRQRYGTAVMAEVLEESVNQATQQVLSERGLRAAMQPKVDLVNTDMARDLEFKVEVELLPEIPMPEFGEINLTRLKAEPSPEAIDKALQELARRQSKMEDVTEDRGAAPGEILTVDYEGRVDGTPFQGGAATDARIEVGGEGYIPGFTQQMEGMKPGETRTIQVTFPEEYGNAELAGKQAEFEIKAKALQKPVPPAIDDEFASGFGFDDLEALRDLMRGQMQREYDQMARLRLKRQLLDALAERTNFPAPEGMVEGEFAQIWQRVEQEIKAGRLDEEDKGKDEETLKSEYRAIAERRVKLGLLLAEIGRTNGITVTPDEITRAMRAEAGRFPGQEQKVMEFFRANPQATDSLRGPIFEDKAVDFVLELAHVEEKPVSPEELAQEVEA